MKSSTIDVQIRARIDSFLGELGQLVKSAALEAVQDALGATVSAPAKRGPGRPSKTGTPSPIAELAPKSRGGKRGKRTSEDVQRTADLLLGYIKSHSGERLEQIGKGLGVPTKGLKLPIQKLLAAKAISTKGQRRGTTYYAK